MIISRTPFRISFAGGGSDLPSFYRQEMGAVLSTSINKYVYIAIHPFFDPNKIQLKYSKTELVSSIDEIQHPIFREVLSSSNLSGVDLNSIADIPSGTGLGSSSSFTVGLLNAIKACQNKAISADTLAKLACEIEIDRLGSPIGKQDQYAAAYGGLNLITFYPDETVNIDKIIMNHIKMKELEENLVMIYTGDVRSANSILRQQNEANHAKENIQTQSEMVKLALNMKQMLENNNIDDFGRYLHEGWLLKKSLNKDISNTLIDDIYSKGLNAGALGGKLLGAGGSGFVLFYCPKEKQEKFRSQLKKLTEMKFQFDNHGSKIIYIGDN
ncbi:MAG: GHMP kinase [Bacteroidetes bacterium]|nr:GHMP kinase [Bacteroidota bacterium]